MDLICIHLREFQVYLDCFEGTVPQHGLKRVHIPPIAQVLDGKRMTEAVRVDVRDAGPLADGAQQFREFRAR